MQHQPTSSDILEQLNQLYLSGQWDTVIQSIKAAYNQLSNYPNTHYLLGASYFQKQQSHDAIPHFENALKLNVQDVKSWYGLGVAQKFSHDLHGAIQSLNNVMKLDPSHLDARAQLAICLRDTNRPQLALQLFQSIEQEKPDYPNIETELAIVLAAMGEEDAAATYYEKALTKNPNDTTAIFHIAHRKKHDEDSAFTKHMKALRDEAEERDNHDKEQVSLNYAWAYQLEKHNKHAEAFEYYAKANYSQSFLYPSIIEEDTQFTNDILKHFTPELMQHHQSSGFTSNLPVFIVGMPRSGTSLTEQILACHPDMTGAGELELLRKIVTVELPKINNATFPEELSNIQSKHLTLLGQQLVTALQTFGPTKHIIDKMPHNFYLIGMIKLLIPNAIIIHCMRDPMDTCWSIWRQAFLSRHTYKYDFNHLAQAYKNYQLLMTKWHELFPGWILDSAYEDLVTDPKQTIETLLNHCGLEWHEDCLNFHEQKRNVFTASTQQVRQPLYHKALHSWEPVADKLQPLLQALQEQDAIPERYKAKYST
ncbi:MAG: sulfotransferase [Rickettsiales bacterium]|nr:sulfotransferase [Rickettsiales bacterium]